MKYRATFAMGAAVGYVLGSKAGRERYEQIRRASRRVTENPAVHDATEAVRARAGELAGTAKTRAGELAGTARDRLGERGGNAGADKKVAPERPGASAGARAADATAPRR